MTSEKDPGFSVGNRGLFVFHQVILRKSLNKRSKKKTAAWQAVFH